MWIKLIYHHVFDDDKLANLCLSLSNFLCSISDICAQHFHLAIWVENSLRHHIMLIISDCSVLVRCYNVRSSIEGMAAFGLWKVASLNTLLQVNLPLRLQLHQVVLYVHIKCRCPHALLLVLERDNFLVVLNRILNVRIVVLSFLFLHGAKELLVGCFGRIWV